MISFTGRDGRRDPLAQRRRAAHLAAAGRAGDAAAIRAGVATAARLAAHPLRLLGARDALRGTGALAADERAGPGLERFAVAALGSHRAPRGTRLLPERTASRVRYRIAREAP